jgi:peptidoglycan hydrolase CwlO-like protein
MAEEEIREDQNTDAHKQFILEKMDEMVEGLGPGYGEALMGELVGRMEKTVAHFHDEVSEMLESLKTSSEEREQKLKKLVDAEAAGEEPSATPTAAEEAGAEDSSGEEQEMSEWEKRIEAKAESKDDASAKGDAPAAEPKSEKKEEPKKKKKGLFGRKKKK